MQEQHLNAAMKSALDKPFQKKAATVKEMMKLAKKIPADLPVENRNYMRTPTAEELVEMRQYAIDFKKKYPKTSKRQLRKEVQQKFHIKIYK